MKSNIKISVVIPTWCRPSLLLDCLEALSQQYFPAEHFEVIVVSDGNDPVTASTIRAWKETSQLQLQYLQLPAKGGPAAARNMGWKNAVGQLVAFTDDDCRPAPDWLENLWCHHRQAQTPIAYTGKVVVPLPARKNLTDHARNTAYLAKADFITANCACTRETLLLTGGFDEQFTMAWREDSDLEFKLLQQDIPIRYVATAVVQHPVRPTKWGSSMRDQRKGVFNALLHRKYPELYSERIGQAPPLLYYVMVLTAVTAVASAIAQHPAAAVASFTLWVIAWLYFTGKRLSGTSHSLSHISEMLVTSAAIPFLSVYWHIYGMIKYRSFFI
jgi:GT2 family glycosyltransferase